MSRYVYSCVESFCRNNFLADLYRSYDWGSDQWTTGFTDILRLEIQLSLHDRTHGITLDDVKDIADWGKLRNVGRIFGETPVLPRNTFCTRAGLTNHTVTSNLLNPLRTLRSSISSGIGPTYFTKILRFSAPKLYGALDTRCVRVFGKGDPDSQQHDWLDLTVKNNGYGWFIPETQKNWPAGFKQWLEILTTFCSILPLDCPHPELFIRQGLRENGVWTCADVEMALFTYASNALT